MSDYDKHMKGFEKELKLNEIWGHPEVTNRLYMRRDFMAVARVFNPELCDGAFEDRPCKRTLRFIGRGDIDEPFRSGKDRYSAYIPGKLFHSTSFNGGSYFIKETGDYVGCVHFKIVEDDE